MRSIYSLNEFEYFEKKYGNGHERRCIDGRVTGSGKCVGYCKYSGHSGFLTERLYREHSCEKKLCDYFVPRERRKILEKKEESIKDRILYAAREGVRELEGMRIVGVGQKEGGVYVLNYISVTRAYSFTEICEELSRLCGVKIILKEVEWDNEALCRLFAV